jgi:hypothetical protein
VIITDAKHRQLALMCSLLLTPFAAHSDNKDDPEGIGGTGHKPHAVLEQRPSSDRPELPDLPELLDRPELDLLDDGAQVIDVPDEVSDVGGDASDIPDDQAPASPAPD